LKAHPVVSSFEKITEFNESPIDKKMIYSAAIGGSVDMMKYLVATQGIDLRKLVMEESEELESYLNKHTNRSGDSWKKSIK